MHLASFIPTFIARRYGKITNSIRGLQNSFHDNDRALGQTVTFGTGRIILILLYLETINAYYTTRVHISFHLFGKYSS